MRIAVKICQLLVGLLFIVSGLVKANDPVGLGYKMQEFFELWSSGFTPNAATAQALSALHQIALGLSIFMITVEVFLGVALLLGWQRKLVLWLLLPLMVFFTFLTGYAFLSGKFTNCGCFGDCLPITPFASFLKDCVLLALIVFLLFGQRYIRPVFTGSARAAALAGALVLALGLQWYALNYLPLADCLPFKKGASLPAQMKPPPGAVPDSFAIRFVYEKGGKTYEFAPENLPSDFTTYKFIDRKQTLVRKGNADAAIRGFALTNDARDTITGNNIDFAPNVMAQPKALLVFAQDFSTLSGIADTKPLVDTALKKRIPVYVVSPNWPAAQVAFHNAGINGVQYFNTDFTIVRTVARTNPTILYLEDGSVRQKWSKKEIDRAVNFLSSEK